MRGRGVVGHLVAVPAPVPELAAGQRVQQRARERVLQRVEDDDDARVAAAQRRSSRRACSPASRAAAARRQRAPTRRSGTRGGSTATTPGARSRSSAWSRRMKPLQRARAGGARRAAARGSVGAAHGARRPAVRQRDRRHPPATVPPPGELLKRLAASGAAYQASSCVAGFLALFTLPLYTRQLTRAQYGYAETLLTAIILVIDPPAVRDRRGVRPLLVRRRRRRARARLARTTTAGRPRQSPRRAARRACSPGRCQPRAARASDDATLMRLGVLGLWAFTNLEIAYALLRVDERRRAYLIASVTNVAADRRPDRVLVVGFDQGARGYVLGNYAASTSCCSGCGFALRGHVAIRRGRAARRSPPMLRFGSPTVPADAAVFALNVIDRAYILRAESRRRGRPVRAGGQARDRGHRRGARLPARVAAAGLLADGRERGRPRLRVRHDGVRDRRPGSWWRRRPARPLGRARCSRRPRSSPPTRRCRGSRSAGRCTACSSSSSRSPAARRSRRATFPAAARGPRGQRARRSSSLVGPLGIAGAGIALCAAYVVMLVVVHLLTRRLFAVPFEWGRLGRIVLIIGGIRRRGTVLPTAGVAGFAARTRHWPRSRSAWCWRASSRCNNSPGSGH